MFSKTTDSNSAWGVSDPMKRQFLAGLCIGIAIGLAVGRLLAF